MNKLKLLPILASFLLLAGMTHSCVDDSHLDSIYDPIANFDQLWKTIDEHYYFFEEKGLDWNEVYSKHRPLVKDDTHYLNVFNICSARLEELKDGHVNLIS